MAQQFFEVAKGLKLNNAVFLAGSGAPNGLNDQASVGIGSFYTDTTDGVMYIKKVAGSGAANWVNLSSNADLQAELDALELQIDNEVTARQNADTALQTAIDDEETNRVAADNALQDEINALEAQVTALGNVFNYVGTVIGGETDQDPFDLATLPSDGKNAGDYYKVSAGGYFKLGAGAAFLANTGDGLVFNLNDEVDVIDNTNSTVSAAVDADGWLVVNGSADTGYELDLNGDFKQAFIGYANSIQGINNDLSNIKTSVGLNLDGTVSSVVYDDLNNGDGPAYINGNESVVENLGRLDQAVHSLSIMYEDELRVNPPPAIINAGNTDSPWVTIPYTYDYLSADVICDILSLNGYPNYPNRLTFKMLVQLPWTNIGDLDIPCDSSVFAVLKGGPDTSFFNNLNPQIEFKKSFPAVVDGVKSLQYRIVISNSSAVNVGAKLNIRFGV